MKIGDYKLNSQELAKIMAESSFARELVAKILTGNPPEDKVDQYLKAKDFIMAIKEHRAIHGSSLAEAKEACVARCAELGVPAKVQRR
jgi:ribosomal protein L7/L12